MLAREATFRPVPVETPETEARRATVKALRARYLAGTLDEVLIPEGARVDELLRDLFGEPG